MFPVKHDPPLSQPSDPSEPTQQLSEADQALLLQGGAQMGLDLQPQVGQFGHLYSLLMEGNGRSNLTALKEPRDIVIKHFLDSLTCARGGFLHTQGEVLDLGTGAGFPALPLAIVYPLRVTALDATRKKVAHVAWAAEQLGLSNLQTLSGRAEALGRDPAYRGRYARVVTRAVAALPVLAELALPLLEVGGLLIAQKGPIGPEELRAGQRAAQLLGGEIINTEHFTLPISGDPRSLVVTRKVKETPAKYPRREGVPSKEPLFWSTQ